MDYELIQLFLSLLACYVCFKAGFAQGIDRTLEFLEKEGVVEIERDE